KARIYKSIFGPVPLASIKGKKVIIAMTANSIIEDKIKNYVEENYQCRVSGITFNLSNRPLLKKDLYSFTNFDAVLTELKAASVDVVTDFAIRSGKEVIYMNNSLIVVDDERILVKDLKDMYSDIKINKN
ncbi:MAG: 2,3-diphosphoglycerate synthetase, partial [Actinomycetota bacterium]|nr:2,3-diphosphoglycerate synthetase [Actinomycetota bacterium]